MSKGKEEDVRIIITITPLEVKVTFSDWLKLNPAKLSRVYEMIKKAWRMERAKAVHQDRVDKAEKAKADADKLAEIVNSEQPTV